MDDRYMGFIETCIGFGMDKEAADFLYKQAAKIKMIKKLKRLADAGRAARAAKAGQGIAQAGKGVAKATRVPLSSVKGLPRPNAPLRLTYNPSVSVNPNAALTAKAMPRYPVAAVPSGGGPLVSANGNRALATTSMADKALPQIASGEVVNPEVVSMGSGRSGLRGMRGSGPVIDAEYTMAPSSAATGALRGGKAPAVGRNPRLRTRRPAKDPMTRSQRIPDSGPTGGNPPAGGGVSPEVANTAVSDLAAGGGGGIGGWMGRHPILTTAGIAIPSFAAWRYTTNNNR